MIGKKDSKIWKRFASNRLCSLAGGEISRNQVVEVEVPEGRVLRIFTLEEEIRHTEWLGGMILLSSHFPVRKENESFAEFRERERILEVSESAGTLHAFHITSFDVSAMDFTQSSRIIPLGLA